MYRRKVEILLYINFIFVYDLNAGFFDKQQNILITDIDGLSEIKVWFLK